MNKTRSVNDVFDRVSPYFFKYLIWAVFFIAYLLCFVGIFKLMTGITSGINVEVDVEREVYGEIIIRKQEVPFNELPAVVWIFGMLGLYITMAGSFLAADFTGKTLESDDPPPSTKYERTVWVGFFTLFFFAFSFLFKVHTIYEIFQIPGIMFMACTCVATNVISLFACRLIKKRQKSGASDEYEGYENEQ